MASHERIDEINILQATYEAMRQAIGKLDPAPDLTLNDAVTIPGGGYKAGSDHKGRCQKHINRGSQHCG